MNILIVKHGALGDVVRTSYFAKALKAKHPHLQIHWITNQACVNLLRFNPYIDHIYTHFDQLPKYEFDIIYSLDDESAALEGVAKIATKRIEGAFLTPNGAIDYSDKSSYWFDMGLISKFGKETADTKKKENQRSHNEIFKEIFEVESAPPNFYGSPKYASIKNRYKDELVIGINPFAGGRWKSKELPAEELPDLIKKLASRADENGIKIRFHLFGAGEDYLRNLEVSKQFQNNLVEAISSDESVLLLASEIRNVNFLITSDSLAVHLAAAQGIPFLAFFAPTSASEIDTFGLGSKITSTSSEYCNYSPQSCNKSISANRVFEAFIQMVPELAGGTAESTVL